MHIDNNQLAEDVNEQLADQAQQSAHTDAWGIAAAAVRSQALAQLGAPHCMELNQATRQQLVLNTQNHSQPAPTAPVCSQALAQPAAPHWIQLNKATTTSAHTPEPGTQDFTQISTSSYTPA
jgi:hypothetical protein